MNFKKVLTAAVSTGMAISLAIVPAAAAASDGTLFSGASALEETVVSALKATVRDNRSGIRYYNVQAIEAKGLAEAAAELGMTVMAPS